MQMPVGALRAPITPGQALGPFPEGNVIPQPAGCCAQGCTPKLAVHGEGTETGGQRAVPTPRRCFNPFPTLFPLSFTPDSKVFLIYNAGAQGCLETKDSLVRLAKGCNASAPAQQWKWVSRNRLFNVGAMQCLGVSWHGANATAGLHPLATYECDRESVNMRWSCRSLGEQLSQHLGARPGNSSLDRGDQARSSQWRTYGTEEDLCSVPYSGNASPGARLALCTLGASQVPCSSSLLPWCSDPGGVSSRVSP